MEGRARAVVIALLVTAAVRAFQLVVAVWQIGLIDRARGGDFVQHGLETSDQLAVVGTIGMFGTLAITCVLFLRWLSRAVDVANTMSPRRLRWSRREAVAAFFIPVISFVRPYLVLRDLHDQLDPGAIPEPASRPRFDGASGYRDVPLEIAPPPRALPHASIGAWWALFMAQQLLGWHTDHPRSAAEFQVTLAKDMASDVLAIGGALLAVLLVRAVHGRLLDRYRKLGHASDEELAAWKIAA
jgi:hypothetical protein